VQNRSEFTPEVYLGANIYRWSESRQTTRSRRIVASVRSSRIPKESKPREKKREETRGDGKSRINKRDGGRLRCPRCENSTAVAGELPRIPRRIPVTGACVYGPRSCIMYRCFRVRVRARTRAYAPTLLPLVPFRYRRVGRSGTPALARKAARGRERDSLESFRARAIP